MTTNRSPSVEEQEATYDARVKVANGCRHPERFGMERKGVKFDVCMSCGELRRNGKREAVCRPPKDYKEAKSYLAGWA